MPCMIDGNPTPEPRHVERRLIVQRFHPDTSNMPPPPGPPEEDGSGGFSSALTPLLGFESYLEDWTLVSHTFSIQPDGEGVLTVLFERPY